MRLAERTDYALRVLMLLAAEPAARRAVPEMAEWFNVSANHLTKVVQLLHEQGWVTTSRGRGGGVQLAAESQRLRVGHIVRAIEPDMHLVECFRPSGACPIQESCGLQGTLQSARQAFLSELDKVTVADLVEGHEPRLLNLTITGC